MPLRAWFAQARELQGAVGVSRLLVDAIAWRQAATDFAAGGARLLALWSGPGEDGGSQVHAVFFAAPGVLVLTLALPAGQGKYPGIESVFPAAARMQRAVRDLQGLEAMGGDTRPWLRHQAWPEGYLPLAAPPNQAPPPPGALRPDQYDFVQVQGDGVHEIAVGPVHAGIIEPGHFRFSVVGEKVLRLEERLGYVHKGIERRFLDLACSEGHRLAARVCGDSAVAYSWAYCQALEGMTGTVVPERAALLRALALEAERIANHLGDLGALGNDAGFVVGLAQFSRLKELFLRACEQAFGQRYLLDYIVPGGTVSDLTAPGSAALERALDTLEPEVRELRRIYDEHGGVRDRFVGTGRVAPELAARLGLTGLAGRASDQRLDLRAELPCEPYDRLPVQPVFRSEGDVAARVAVRFEEFAESCRLVRLMLQRLPSGPSRQDVPAAPSGRFGIGLVEGWRGPVLIALQSGAADRIVRCHPHDPSWQNWPVLEHAIIGNIVPDFPLINKSFNLAYSGHDL